MMKESSVKEQVRTEMVIIVMLHLNVTLTSKMILAQLFKLIALSDSLVLTTNASNVLKVLIVQKF